ncbi:MAG: cupredoxin domain-containing protein, partial [Actinomycetota bacterium]|nr:cupredoxin domain-containing protein [Actinomycetota bacterium]
MKRFFTLTPTLLALAVVLAACGGDTQTEDQAAQPPQSVSTGETGEAPADPGRDAGHGTGHDAGHGDEHGAGQASGPVDRTIEVTMLDGRYEPSEFRVKAGETVRFVFHNRGTQIHEPGLGDEAEHNRHEKQMQELGRRMHHDEDTGHPVEPGQTTELVRTFKAGEQ